MKRPASCWKEGAMKGRLAVIACLVAILGGFVLLETLATTYTESLASSTLNSGWVESGSPPLTD
jgi:hypothetical protein